jgi:uncharacterized protein (TIGR02302 family)
MTQENAPELPPPSAPAGLTVQRRLVLAWLALSWERIWVRLWLVGMACAVFGIVLLTDVLPSLHWIIHLVAVLGAAGGIGYLTWRRLQGFTWPTRGEARARLETTSPVEHRPLTAVEDKLVAGASSVQEWMWRRHQDKARDDLDRLRVKAPAPGVATRDHFALRAAVILALFVAVVGGWGDMGNRFWRGVAPMFGGDTSNVNVKLWITPPEYTALSPLYIETPLPDGAMPIEKLEIPAGSTALAIVTGTARDTFIKFGDNTAPLEKLADESQRGEVELKPIERLEVRQAGRMLAGWDVSWLKDNPPGISMPTPPAEAGRWRWRIDYLARDDYGINTVTAQVTKADDPRVLEFPLAVPAGAGNTFVHSSMHDLAADLWAGENVMVKLIVTDHAGQGSESEAKGSVLPLRVFKHPVSIELAKWRKGIAQTPAQVIPLALASVTQILQRPDSFGGEPLVHLTLNTAKYRMTHDAPDEAAPGAVDLLWHAAVRIEDGNLVNAEQRLVDAEKALREALERGASAEEINRLLQELKQAVAEYSKALAEKEGPKDSQQAKDARAQEEALNQTMDEIKDTKEMGAEEAAKKALAALQEQLQALREGKKPGEDNPLAEQAQKMMEELNKLASEQSELASENFDKQKHMEGEQGEDGESTGEGGSESGQPSEGEAKESAAKQQALRQKLDELIDGMQAMLGNTPEGMSDADAAMDEAITALDKQDLKAALEAQLKATDDLQKGITQAQQEIQQAMLDKGLSEDMAPELAGMQERYSPLAPREGVRGGDKVTLPTEPDTKSMAQRVRLILDEIRRRSEDRTRPEAEQEYLQRLKKQF